MVQSSLRGGRFLSQKSGGIRENGVAACRRKWPNSIPARLVQRRLTRELSPVRVIPLFHGGRWVCHEKDAGATEATAAGSRGGFVRHKLPRGVPVYFPAGPQETELGRRRGRAGGAEAGGTAYSRPLRASYRADLRLGGSIITE